MTATSPVMSTRLTSTQTTCRTPNYLLSFGCQQAAASAPQPLPVLQPRECCAVEKLAAEALPSLDGDMSGRNYGLKSMTWAEQQQLTDDHFLFDNPVSPLLLASSMARDRHNVNKTFLVWINEEDHTRFISTQIMKCSPDSVLASLRITLFKSKNY